MRPIVNGLRPAFPTAFLFLVCAHLFGSTVAQAAPCIADPGPGVIKDKWLAMGGHGVLGCPLTTERDVPGNDGRYVQFQNGQVVFSPRQRMVVAAWEDAGANGLSSTAKVDWTVLDTFSYDFFLIRWRVEGDDEDKQHETDAGGTGGFHEFTDDDERGAGHFRIVVEGCEDGGFLRSSRCHQGWSNPAHLDLDYIDVSRAWSFDRDADKWKRAKDLATPATVADAIASASLRRAQAIARECRRIPEGAPGEDNTTAALARLDVVHESVVHPALCLEVKPDDDIAQQREKLKQSVNAWLAGTEPDAEVGTNVDPVGFLTSAGAGAAAGAAWGGLPGAVIGFFGGLGASQVCSRDGDYDFALTLLLPIAYEHRVLLEHSTYDHMLDTLLTEKGGVDKVSGHISICSIPVSETENHILMTESARYLSNQLLLRRAGEQDPTHTTKAFLDADLLYNNTRNGLRDFMLQHLQHFLKSDFHEYNARPYSRLSTMALQNLANYADLEVSTAASLVLDYLGARFSVSASQLRRSPPFRRRGELRDKTELLGRYSDQDTWRMLEAVGSSEVLHGERFGHAPWNAGGVMAFPRIAGSGVPRYQLPPLVADLIVNRTLAYWQGLRHEGAEVYMGTPELLISGGGHWEPNLSRDSIAFLSGADTNGNAMPTLLVPQFEGLDRADMIRIEGHSDREKRDNTCVTFGFACGLNPIVPEFWLRRFPPGQRPCRHAVIGLIREEWTRLGLENGILGCPLEPEQNVGDGSFVQEFERGKVALSAPQKMLLSAHYSKSSPDIVVEWRIVDEFSYDFFIVRFDKNGSNIGQRDLDEDDAGMSSTSGTYSMTPEGVGTFSIIVEGCESGFLASSDCDQSWSTPLVLDYPSKRSCARVTGNWLFVSSIGECNFIDRGRGFYAAVYSEACSDDDECEDENFGFFETTFRQCFVVEGFGCESFDEFISGVLAQNGATDFTPAGVNQYKMRFDSTVTFTPDHSRNDSGIVNISIAGLPRGVPFVKDD